jgi:hypothetical protein
MTQYARPDADLVTGNWSANSGTSLYAVIDETSPADVDYISVTDDYVGTDQSCQVELSSVTDPDSTTAHTVLVRAYTDSYSGSVTLSIALGTSSGTIKTASFTPTTSFANYTMTLSTSEAAGLSSADYADLRLQISAEDSMAMGSETRVSWAYFSCPDAPVSVTPPAAAIEAVAIYVDTSSQTVTPNAASFVTAASLSTVRLGILKTIGTTSTVGTATPNSTSGSDPYTVGFSSAVTGAAVGDKVYFDDYSTGSVEQYIYSVTTVNSTTSFDLTFVSGGSSGNVTPYGNLYAADFTQASGLFKRVFDYTTPRAWAADLDDASIYSNDDDAIGAIAVNEKYDETLGLDCNGDNVTLSSIKLTVLSDVRHDGTAGSGAGLRWTSSSSAGGPTAASQWIYLASPNITIEWLECDGSAAAASSLQLYFFSGWDDVGNIHIRNNLLYGLDQKGGGIVCRGIRLETPSGTVIGTSSILNNIVYDIEPSSPSGGDVVGIYAIGGRAENAIYLYNNTVHHIVGTGTASGLSGFGRGIQSSSHTYVTNNIVSDVTAPVTADDFYGNEHADSDYNLSTDTTAPGSNSVTSATLADIYESATGTINLHLKSGSPAIDAGTDLGTSPTGVNIDIDGRNRDSEGDTWSIGADQYFVNGIEVAPSAASCEAAAVSPAIALGSLTVTVSAAAMVAAAISPTITFSSTTATPTAATVIAQTISPTTLLGNLSITPSAASFVATCVDPTVGGALTISPASASLTTAASASAVQGALSITPAAASGVATATSPSIVEGTLSIGPAAASITATAVSPSLSFSSVTVTPTAAAFVATGISPTAVFGSTTVTPTAGSFESVAISPTVVFGSDTATPTAATLTTAATATVVQGSLSVSVTGSTIEVICVSPTAVSSSIAITPEAAVTVSQVLVGAIIQGNLLVVIPAVVQLDYAAVAPTVVFGSDTATSAAAVAVTSASASIDLDDLSITPSAAVVALNTVSPTILAGETITASAAVIVINVPPVTVSASFDAASLDYSIAGVLDYECNGNTDYSLSGQLNYNA